MSSYYIKEPSSNNVSYYSTVSEVVGTLEQLCRKIFRQDRKTFMLDMQSLGHGYDDPNGTYFTELMADKVEIGIINREGRLKRCNIHEHARNSKYRNETGD